MFLKTSLHKNSLACIIFLKAKFVKYLLFIPFLRPIAQKLTLKKVAVPQKTVKHLKRSETVDNKSATGRRIPIFLRVNCTLFCHKNGWAYVPLHTIFKLSAREASFNKVLVMPFNFSPNETALISNLNFA